MLGAVLGNERGRNMEKKVKMRSVEYFRCWNSSEGDRGEWDTDYIEIPADTPDDKVEQAIRDAVDKAYIPQDRPLFVGLYCDGGPEELEDEEEADPKDDTVLRNLCHGASDDAEHVDKQPEDELPSIETENEPK